MSELLREGEHAGGHFEGVRNHAMRPGYGEEVRRREVARGHGRKDQGILRHDAGGATAKRR